MAGFCSCSDEDEQVGNGRSIHTFTATIEGNDADTRATFNSDRLCAYWEQTDEININGKVYKATAAGATTSFVATDEDAEGETFEAFFPASLINEETLTLPAAGQVSQYYALNQVGSYGFYWTSDCGDYQNTAWGITIDNAPTTNMNRETNANRQRNVGTSVRAVLNELP